MLTKQNIAAFAALGVSALIMGLNAAGPVSAQTPTSSAAAKAAGNARHDAAVDKEAAYRKRLAAGKEAGYQRHEAAVDKAGDYRKRLAAGKEAGYQRHEASVDKEEAYHQRVAAAKAAKAAKAVKH